MNCYEAHTFDKDNAVKAALIFHTDDMVKEMASIAWLQNDVAEENASEGQPAANLHQYVDLGEEENLKLTMNWLRTAHSECEGLLEGLLLPVDNFYLTLTNDKSEDASFVTEILLRGCMRPSDAERIAYSMNEYMMHSVLRQWASLVAPQYAQYWNDALQYDAKKLYDLNQKRNRRATVRQMSVM